MDEFNNQNGVEPENNDSVNLSKENNPQGYYQAPQDSYQNPQNNYQNPQDNGGRVAYGQPGYGNNNNSGYNPSGTGYSEPQTGYNQNGYNQGYNPNGYNQGYNQNSYDMNDPNNYQYNQYGGYQDPYGGYRRPPSQGPAIASLVCGIVGLSAGILGWAFPLLFLVPIVGLVLGIVHKVKYPGFMKGMSTAGIILSSIGIVLPFVFIIAMIAYLPELMEYMRQIDPESYQEIYDEYADELPGMFSAAFAAVKSIFIK